MLNLSKYSIAKIIPVVVFLFGFPLGFYLLDKEGFFEKKKMPTKLFHEKLTEFVSLISLRWEQGDKENIIQSGQYQCTDIPAVLPKFPSSFFQCNSAYMKCFLEGGLSGANLTPLRDLLNIKYLAHKTYVDSKDSLIIKFLLKDTDKEISIKLDNYCHQTYLPRRVYSSGLGQGLNKIWDNYSQDIFVDKFNVNNYEVEKWRSNYKKDKIEKDSFLPALKLNLDQMKKFCLDRGKQLLQAHIFDASSFFPSSLENGYIFKSKYPWGNEKKETGFEKSVSWNGVFFPLGGEMEVFKNIFTPHENLKVSNSNLKKNNPWNQIALRAHWDGEGRELKNFEFTQSHSVEVLPVERIKGVAFRCMSKK